MKTFLRDMIIAMLVFFLTLAAMGWWNAPAYKACARSHSQTMCYTVLK
jgi:hypothetical protein